MDQRFDKFIKHSPFSGMLLALSPAVEATESKHRLTLWRQGKKAVLIFR